MRHRSVVKGFSRGIPIIGQRDEEPDAPARGRYYYQVPFLIVREGQPLTADTCESWLNRPMGGPTYKYLTERATEYVKGQAPDLPEPKVILLQPFFLGFTPQEAIDQAEAEAKANENGQADKAVTLEE